jgi:hypothetical protein
MSTSDYLGKLFADFPPGKALLAEVRAFYGPSFRVNFHDEPDGVSHFGRFAASS